MKKNVDIPDLIVGDNSGSTQAPPNEDGGDTGRRTVVTPSRPSLRPPISPYSKISTFEQQLGLQNFSTGPSLQRSMSQPSFTFSSLPPRSPSSALFTSSPSWVPVGRSPNSGSSTVPLSDDDPSLPNPDHTLPPRKAHKLSNTDDISSRIPLPQSTFAVPSIRESQIFNDAVSQFSQVLNFDKREALEGNENTGNDDMEKNVGAGSTSSGVKRRAGKETAPSSRRLTKSASMGDFRTGVEPPSSPTYAGMFTPSEIDKIKGDTKLAELAVTSPKKARKTLANRESAARSQEKKAKYVAELEGEIQALRAENTAIRALYNQLRNDHIAMESEHRELVIRYEGLEKQVQLHQELHAQSSARISELTNELNQYRIEANRSNMQQSSNPNMFHQLNINQPQGNPDFDGQI